MVYATSDLHGYPLIDFLDLLRKAQFGRDDFLFVLGDVIDRNCDGGIALLRWMMQQPNVELLLGNHEALLLDCAFLFEEVTDASLDSLNTRQLDALSTWMLNGAEPTLRSLKRLYNQDPEELQDLLDYLRDAPLYETVSLEGGDFLLVHSGLMNFDPERPLHSYDRRELLWCRPAPQDRYFRDVHTILGHTPTQILGGEPGRAYRTETWTCIDAGAAGGGSPMLLRLDDMHPFYAD